MHGSNISFVWKMDLKMFMVGIESYGNIFLYFYEFGNMKGIFDFGFYDPFNGYKLDKYDPCQWE